jgi:phospholipid transport system substrate-binding protein
MVLRSLLGILALLAAIAHAEDFVAPSPDKIVRQVVDQVLSTLRQHREFTQDLRKMDGLVETDVLPHFDFIRMTRLTIGNKYWDEATQEDRQQLVSEYRAFLAHTFSNTIALYTNQTIFITPLHMLRGEKEITVRTTILDPVDEPTQLNYMMEKTESGWMIYDIEIDNISLTRIYRSNFSRELHKGGVHSLLGVLHQKNLEVEATRHG